MNEKKTREIQTRDSNGNVQIVIETQEIIVSRYISGPSERKLGLKSYRLRNGAAVNELPDGDFLDVQTGRRLTPADS